MPEDIEGGNGFKGSGGPIEETIETPLFEKELLEPGLDPLKAVTKTNFEDDQTNINAAIYIGHLMRCNKTGKFDNAILTALLRINGNRSIDSQSIKFAVQAHGRLFWDINAKKDDKKAMAKLNELRQRNRGDEDKD